MGGFPTGSMFESKDDRIPFALNGYVRLLHAGLQVQPNIKMVTHPVNVRHQATRLQRLKLKYSTPLIRKHGKLWSYFISVLCRVFHVLHQIEVLRHVF